MFKWFVADQRIIRYKFFLDAHSLQVAKPGGQHILQQIQQVADEAVVVFRSQNVSGVVMFFIVDSDSAATIGVSDYL